MIGGDFPDGRRNINGVIDEVAVFNYALNPAQILSLFGLPPVTLSIHMSGADVILTWPFGTLESADDVTGPYSPVSGATSPFMVTPSEAKKFYRVVVVP